MSGLKGKREMAGNHHGESSSSVDLELGLRRACVASLVEKRKRFLSENKGKRVKKPSIWRVRSEIRNQDPKAYEPRLVSIGPYHYGKKELSFMQELKLENLCFILATYPGKTLEDYVNEVFDLLPQARDEYSENIELSDDKFAEMLVLDGCFIIGFLVKFEPYTNSPFIAQVHGSYDLLWRDMMLIENQIPLFVVRKLSDMIAKEMSGGKFSLDIVSTIIKWIHVDIPGEKYPQEEVCRHLLHLKCLSLNPNLFPDESPRQSYWHRVVFLVNKLVGWIFAPFLGLFYLILFRDCSNLFSASDTSKESNHRGTIPGATELHESGVKFKMMPKTEQRLLRFVPKASFKNGTLEINWLSVHDSTCSELRNLVTFEQCFKEVDPYFTCYCIFLDYLINTAEDVALLRKSAVLENRIGSDSALAEMFNGLGKEIFTDDRTDPFQILYKELRNFCEAPHNKWKASFSQKYFSSPWTLISVFAAATLIAFTITQTVFTIKQLK